MATMVVCRHHVGMKQFVNFVVAAIVLQALVGCSSDDGGDSLVNAPGGVTLKGSANIVGTYQLDKDALRTVIMAQRPVGTPAVGPAAEASLKMVDQMLDGMAGSIFLDADNSCRMTMAMMGQKKSLLGSWKLNDELLAITASEQGLEEETRLAKFANGMITIEQESNGQSMSMQFRRVVK